MVGPSTKADIGVHCQPAMQSHSPLCRAKGHADSDSADPLQNPIGDWFRLSYSTTRPDRQTLDRQILDR